MVDRFDSESYIDSTQQMEIYVGARPRSCVDDSEETTYKVHMLL